MITKKVRTEISALGKILSLASNDPDETFLLDTLKLAEKVLQELIVTRLDPNPAVMHDICLQGTSLTIDVVLRSGIYPGLSRDEITRLMDGDARTGGASR